MNPVAADPSVLTLLAGTVALRPYVVAFLVAFLAAAGRDLGARRTAGFLLWGWLVAFAAEYASTRVGIPFGLYHYTGDTRRVELFLSNVPAFDSVSFPFLAYAAFCVARATLGAARRGATVALAGVLMMLLDVVIDPLAVRGDRWFLGRIFYYPAGGVYFGVPLSNFAGWLLVGWAIVGGYVRAESRAPRGSPMAGVGLYVGVLAFNLALTAWIGEWALLGAGILVHAATFLVLYTTAGATRIGSRGARPAAPPTSPGAAGSREPRSVSEERGARP
jgi:putative membrane protein